MINRFNRKVQITTRRKVSNGRGGFTWTDIDLGGFWCYREPITIDRQIRFQQADIRASFKYYFIYDYRIDETSIIHDGDYDFYISTIGIPNEKGFFMEVLVDGEIRK